jgi:hypothetical protein
MVDATPPVSQEYIFRLSILATSGLAVMWTIFWIAVIRARENVTNILTSAGFFRTVTVMGVIASTVVLSLSGRLEGNITGAILSGIAGYVLGHISARGALGKTKHNEPDSESTSA